MSSYDPAGEWMVYRGKDGKANAITQAMYFDPTYGPKYQHGSSIAWTNTTFVNACEVARKINQGVSV